MDWIEIKNSNDAEELMDRFGGFHDGCIKELKYIGGEYVSEDLGMCPFNKLRKLSVIFQRQFNNPYAIEIVFEGLRRMNLAQTNPYKEGKLCFCDIIYCAYLNIIDGIIYWADWEDFDISKIDIAPDYKEHTWIISEKAKWRIADNYIGSEEIYVNKK